MMPLSPRTSGTDAVMDRRPRETTRGPGCCPPGNEPGDDSGQPCCGGPQAPPAGPMARPGYELCPYVASFLTTLAGPAPVVHTRLDRRDHLGTLGARLGYGRDGYRVAPGLYAVGRPGPQAPVLLTADYKLTFDSLRRELAGIDAWILVLDTRGVNVWCAAGKKNFSAREVARVVAASNLSLVVSHRRLVAPQLAAPGLDAREAGRLSGYEVVFGPVRAADLPTFLKAGNRADPAMRRVTFTLGERLAVTPVEVWHARKWLWWAALAAFFVSGLGPGWFSPEAAWRRGIWFLAALAAGFAAGALGVPILLPWLPGRAFAVKGAVAGGLAGALVVLAGSAGVFAGVPGTAAPVFLAMAVGSFLAMNFTGSTPFTSPSGVEREMRAAMPLQAVCLAAAAACWIVSAL